MVIHVVNDRLVGAGLVAVSVIVIIVYNALLFIPIFKGIDILLLKLTAAVAVTAAFALLGWIGYTLATIPPPKPIEEIEKELEEELKKLEAEIKKNEEKTQTPTSGAEENKQ